MTDLTPARSSARMLVRLRNRLGVESEQQDGIDVQAPLMGPPPYPSNAPSRLRDSSTVAVPSKGLLNRRLCGRVTTAHSGNLQLWDRSETADGAAKLAPLTARLAGEFDGDAEPNSEGLASFLRMARLSQAQQLL